MITLAGRIKVMKKLSILLGLLVLLSASVFAQKQMSARQLFMALPGDYVVGSAKERAAYLTFSGSIKADFLTFMITEDAIPKSLAGDFREPQGLVDMRVFRGGSRSVVGLTYQLGDGREATPTTDKTRIVTVMLEYRGGKWTNITPTILPTVSVKEAHEVLVKNFQMTEVSHDDVRVEAQMSKDRNGMILVARVKGSDSVTILKQFTWNGKAFVERG